MAELAVLDELHGADAEAGAENAVERGGRAAALQVAQHHGARLAIGPHRDLVCDLRADAAQPGFPLGIGMQGGEVLAPSARAPSATTISVESAPPPMRLSTNAASRS